MVRNIKSDEMPIPVTPESNIEVEYYSAPACWASYLIYGEVEGLSDEDIKQADAFAEWLLPGYITNCEHDAYFSHRCDAPGVKFAGDMIDYTVLTNKP